MVNISASWLDSEQDREIFTSLPLLAPLLPALEEAHQGLHATQIQRSPRPGRPQGARDALNAKNAWIRVVRAIESNLDLEKAATPEIVDRLLSRLHREEAKADRRTASSPKANGAGAEPLAPEPAPAGA